MSHIYLKLPCTYASDNEWSAIFNSGFVQVSTGLLTLNYSDFMKNVSDNFDFMNTFSVASITIKIELKSQHKIVC